MKSSMRIKFKATLFLGLASFLVTEGFAKDSEKDSDRYPLGCYNEGYKFDLKILNFYPGEVGKNQSMYFLYNKLTRPINLFQMRAEDSSRSLFLNHAINPRQWAVFSTNEKQVKFICTVPDGKSYYGQVVDCGDSVKVCEYTNVRYGLNNRGNYWIVSSNTRGGAIRDVIHYGIIPAQ